MKSKGGSHLRWGLWWVVLIMVGSCPSNARLPRPSPPDCNMIMNKEGQPYMNLFLRKIDSIYLMCASVFTKTDPGESAELGAFFCNLQRCGQTRPTF